MRPVFRADNSTIFLCYQEIWKPSSPWTLRACPSLYRDWVVSVQLLPVFMFIRRHLFFLQNIKNFSLIYLILITLTTLRVSLCYFIQHFLLPARLFEIFFSAICSPSMFPVWTQISSSISTKTHKIFYEYSFEKSTRRKRYKKKIYDNLYMTPKVLTPNRRKSKPQDTCVLCELKFNYRIFNQKIRYHCMGHFILIKYSFWNIDFFNYVFNN